MISIGFDDQGKIGLQYVTESLHPIKLLLQ